jgi:outer membrane protein assembly factor BamA
MRKWLIGLLMAIACFTIPSWAQCAKDNRENKKGGIQVTDFTITGTTTLSATEMARMTGELTGSCFNDDSDEMGERVRALFQDQGYFKAEVKSIRMKPGDPLGNPKPVTLEAEVDEGPQFKLDQITFLENHAVSAEKLRSVFPLKKGDVFARAKVASGLGSLRKIYGTRGYLDMYAIPDTSFAGAANLRITVTEGPQYHMGKLDIVADKELADRLKLQWKLAEGSVYDATYIDNFLEKNRDLLPEGFSAEKAQVAKDCPEALVAVRLMVADKDPGGDAMKEVPCEEKSK